MWGKPLIYAVASHICNIKKLNHINEEETEVSDDF
jgi:hypothetical protein